MLLIYEGILTPTQPRVVARAAQGREPHLPVQTGLVGDVPSQRLGQFPWLVFELVGPPGLPVIRSFHNDFPPFGGHHRERPVAVHQAKRRGDLGQSIEWLNRALVGVRHPQQGSATSTLSSATAPVPRRAGMPEGGGFSRMRLHSRPPSKGRTSLSWSRNTHRLMVSRLKKL